MKTGLLIIIGTSVIAFVMFMMPVFSFADCGGSTLQSHYDSTDNVFHGTLISKQHDPDRPHNTTMIFDVQKSLKGMDSKSITVKFNEGYDKKFEQGYEYVVFAQGTEQPLEIELCGRQPYAFATIVSMVSQLDDPDNSFGHILEYDLDDHLTEPEKMQLEGLDENFAKERQKERDRLFGQIMLIGIPAAIVIGVAIMWVKTMRTK